MRKSSLYKLNDPVNIIEKLMLISEQEDTFCLLNSNHHNLNFCNYNLIAAVGEYSSIETNYFDEISSFQQSSKDWCFGYFSYDLKNNLEQLQSNNIDNLKSSEAYFFIPKYLLIINGNKVEIQYIPDDTPAPEHLIEILNSDLSKNNSIAQPPIIKARETFAEYISAVNHLKDHIKKGDIYEANYCTEFYAENCTINPNELYKNLNTISPNPFSTFFKHKEITVFSASPERFIQRKNNTLISQPIKGTAKRTNNATEDLIIKQDLEISSKDRSENIMIVDLVRNDLSKHSIKNSVVVEELCKVYTFPLVHQMISTVSAKVDEKTNHFEIIKSAFPPGSMTGAPKVKAMELIEQYEKTKRGIYSGAIGYFDPTNNFDFNVVIRTIVYNSKNKYLSIMVGGAITDNSIPEKEYEECLIKAKAMLRALNIDESIFANNAVED